MSHRVTSSMDIFLSFVGCVTFPLLYCCTFFFTLKAVPGKSAELYYSVSTRVVSLIQAVAASCIGLRVILRSSNIMKDRFLSINNYAWFAVSYFYYDLVVMFLESYKKYSNERFMVIFQRFLSKKWLIVCHHLFLPLIGFPIIVFYRNGLGDFFVGCIYCAEMSTPFLSINAILGKLDMKRYVIYRINGLLLAISYLHCRILIFPFMYYSYARYADLYIWQVPLVIPFKCNVACLGLFSLQMFWFLTILDQIRKQLGF